MPGSQPSIGQLLATAGIDPFEARLLLAHALGLTRVQLITKSHEQPGPAQVLAVRELFARRRAGEPVAYLVGYREFHALRLRVTPDVLIPRPETELLVDLASERIDRFVEQGVEPASLRVLDLGTGSGAIAIALAHLHPGLRVTAVDISAAALALARGNATAHGLDIEFIEGSWFEGLAGRRFDLIVSNPPYVRADDPHLGQGDLRFEPVGALTDRFDGLAALRVLCAQGAAHLLAGGCLLMEHGFDQAVAVRGLLLDAGFVDVASWVDLAGIERVSGGRVG
ncbi:peptide chain release factor N(5)-glutamine methyltransferase [Lacisediminimonas sp.]|uniref:peptide chain release factor N(5)-glutamine methyltransferase n=1 Tax=Lacisediminimonas sp. TaxID=3060582 RepID=UPI00271943E8|nr:peptide chain release factor N(5)-glutamine methyltransferase [Lacisediminimonas sp.]MDO8300102.1 peptide chain release factor N(5)-glutamine methyltransferase [Lacisediminimonas sp.]